MIRSLLFTAGLLAVVFIYVASFWGRATCLLPAPFDEWHDIFYRLLGPWWTRNVLPALSMADRIAAYRGIEAFVLGLLVPAVALRLSARSLADAGLCLPDARGRRLGLACLLLVVPIGFHLAAAAAEPWGSPLYEAMELSAMVPEHFMLFGVVAALVLPGRRLRKVERAGRVSGAGAPACPRYRARFLIGLSDREALAVCLAGGLFYLMHVGATSRLETLLSLPVGLLFAYVTVQAGSIWPGVVAHWALNLVPLTWQAIGLGHS